MHKTFQLCIHGYVLLLAMPIFGMKNTYVKPIGKIPYSHTTIIDGITWSPQEDRCLVVKHDSSSKTRDARIYDVSNFTTPIVTFSEQAGNWAEQITFNPNDARKILYRDSKKYITVLDTEASSVVGRIQCGDDVGHLIWNGDNVVVQEFFYDRFRDPAGTTITEYTSDFSNVVYTERRFSEMGNTLNKVVSINGEVYLSDVSELFEHHPFIANITKGSTVQLQGPERDNPLPIPESSLALVRDKNNNASVYNMTNGSLIYTLPDKLDKIPSHIAHDKHNNQLIFADADILKIYRMNELITVTIDPVDHVRNYGIHVLYVEKISPQGTYVVIQKSGSLGLYKVKDLYLAALARASNAPNDDNNR